MDQSLQAVKYVRHEDGKVVGLTRLVVVPLSVFYIPALPVLRKHRSVENNTHSSTVHRVSSHLGLSTRSLFIRFWKKKRKKEPVSFAPTTVCRVFALPS